MSENQSTPVQVHIYEASAGSGKTYALARRYLQLLFEPGLPCGQIPLRNILAITFTNKATLEMKTRIIDILKRIALDSFTRQAEAKDILSSIPFKKERARARACAVMDELICHYNFFQVQTIDSFVNTLLLGSALNINRSAHFKIKKDYLAYLAYCLDLVIDEAQHTPRVLEFLEEFLEHYLFVENRTGWFPKKDMLLLIQSLFRLSNQYGRPFVAYPGKSVDVIKTKKKLYQKIEEIASGLPEGMNKTAQKSLHTFLEKNDPIFDISGLPACFVNDLPPINKNSQVSSDFKKKWRQVHSQLKKLIELDAKTAYTPYIRLFDRLIDAFGTVSQKEDTLFLEELNRVARGLFDEGGVTVAEVYYRLAGRFHDYLIDEFQDTSSLQWRNLYLMVEEALSCGGTLFYVGDKKQAIYRFRGGRAQLFDEVKEQFARYPTRVTQLTKNWRSERVVVEFNNTVFSRKNLIGMLDDSGIVKELDDTKAIEEVVGVFSDAEQEYVPDKDKGYVYVEHLDEKNIRQRNECMQPKVVGLIRSLRDRSFRYEDIALLARDNNEVELLTSWLLQAQIPVASEKTLNVIQHRLIKELISFIGFLHSPLDDVKFAGFILGDIFTSQSGITHKEITDFLFTLHRDRVSSEGSALYRVFRGRYGQIWDTYIDEFFRNVGFLSLYELLIDIYRRYRLLESFGDDQAFFMKFLELVKNKEEECIDIGSFLEYLPEAPGDELYVNVIASDSVKVHTIHKAKGLEFPVVIVPFLRMDITPETAGRGTNSYVLESGTGDLHLVRVTKQHRAFIDELKNIYEENYKKACIDELNNIYVALTRAQYELHVFVPKKSGIQNNKAYFLIPEGKREYGAPATSPISRDPAPPVSYLPVSRYQDWIGALAGEFTASEEILNRVRIARGNFFHAVLAGIVSVSEENLDEMIACAIKKVAVRCIFPGAPDEYQKIITEFIKKKKMRPFFFCGNKQVFCEKEIVSSGGQGKRVDRLIVEKDEVWVVDYKSAYRRQDEAVCQMKEYLALLTQVYSGRRCRGFLLFIEEMKVEEVNDE
ncbi:MAG: UvrD-helicase domain-containing protein [Candidatus Omnitrophica bacterium]|nr:UvrD-helicase domain-containing protein [Candidatus Omnitrophota bacterium]